MILKKPPAGLFIAGTDTEVGKTYVAALIVKSLVAAGHRVGVYKPAASDCVYDGNQMVAEDALFFGTQRGRPLNSDAVCPQRFVLRCPASICQVRRKTDRYGIVAYGDFYLGRSL